MEGAAAAESEPESADAGCEISPLLRVSRCIFEKAGYEGGDIEEYVDEKQLEERDGESREEWLERINLMEAKRLWKESVELIKRMEKLDFSRVKTDNVEPLLQRFTELKERFDFLLRKQRAGHRYGSSPAIDCLRHAELLKVNETELKVMMSTMVFENQRIAKSIDKRLIEFDEGCTEECREGGSLPSRFVVPGKIVNRREHQSTRGDNQTPKKHKK